MAPIKHVLALLALLEITAFPHTEANSEASPPNILFVLIDDLGWGDVGFHQKARLEEGLRKRQEAQTPVMDQLVREGVELNRHYVHSSCTGTRTALQSGRLPVHVMTGLPDPEDPNAGKWLRWSLVVHFE